MIVASLKTISVLGRVLQLALFSLLVLLAPIVRLVLMSAGLLLIVMAVVLRASSAAPHLPFWLMIALGVACAASMLAYTALLNALAPGAQN